MSPASNARSGANWRSANLTSLTASFRLTDEYVTLRLETLRRNAAAHVLIDIDGLFIWRWIGPPSYLAAYIREDRLEGSR